MVKDASKTKELIDDIALRLFVEKGVTATTTKNLARTQGFRGHPLPPLRQQK